MCQVQTAFPYLSKNNGRIVFTSSGVSVRPTKSWAAYSCGKAAMNQLCSSLAYEEPSISVVAVTPGIVDTNIQKIVRDTRKFTRYISLKQLAFSNLVFMPLCRQRYFGPRNVRLACGFAQTG